MRVVVVSLLVCAALLGGIARDATGLNALLLMHRKYGTETDRYWNAFVKQWAFIESHQLDPEHGGWYGETTREGKRLGDGAKAT